MKRTQMETECTVKKGDWTSCWVVKNLSINWLTSCTESAKLGAEVSNKQVVDEQSKQQQEVGTEMGLSTVLQC
jgi:hypothetical protein